VPWAPDYITTAEAKAFTGVTDTVDDAQYALWITAASRAVDSVCSRQFGQVSTLQARTYRRAAYYLPDEGLYAVDVDDVYDITGMLVAGVALASSGATILPDSAPIESRPWTRLGFTSYPTLPLVVTALWGWTAIPNQVKAACELQVNRWNFRRNAPAGVAGSPDQGSEVRLLAKLDPDVSTSLAGLRRRRRAA
jgi:hypothetical protein